MGTTWQVTVASDRDASELRAGIQRRLDEVVAEMSTWEADSDISRFNAAPAGTAQVLPEGFFRVLQAALDLAAGTGGAYDPTVGPLVNLWGFGPDGERLAAPTEAATAAARARTGWQRLALDPERRIAIQPGGLYLDLSSIAKGHAVDRVAGYLEASGSTSWLVEVGGELRARGRHPAGRPWHVAVEHPDPQDAMQRGDAIVVALEDLAMATSGDYRHFFDDAGQRYSHTIDPRTARPVAHALASVTVLHRDCMQADALATAMSVLGPDEGWRYALEHDLAVLFFVHEGDGFRQRMTPAFARQLSAP
ncbi:FAD:protein FMN transferase [Lysobacter aestuarii]|uniref:FAD:protein FMN transferase n=2 Tax=Marilutibacter aestuarii TaxID=1706195 RepID=A0A508AIP5_9GAMM|nr:FAD:protein FMN transferase [Lysobacter aestuarii]